MNRIHENKFVWGVTWQDSGRDELVKNQYMLTSNRQRSLIHKSLIERTIKPTALLIYKAQMHTRVFLKHYRPKDLVNRMLNLREKQTGIC